MNNVWLDAVMESGGSYLDYLMSFSFYAYYPLSETSGAVADNLGTLGNPADGNAVGVTWAQVAAPGGIMAPRFDGVNDYVGIDNSAFVNAFNGNSLTYVCWFKVYDIGVLTDGLQKVLTIVYANLSNYFSFQKYTTSNLFRIYCVAGGTPATRNVTITDTNWHCICATISSNVLKVYLDGYQVGANISYGTFSGTPAANTCLIGSSWGGGPLLVFNGYISHTAFRNSAISAAEVLSVYQRGL